MSTFSRLTIACLALAWSGSASAYDKLPGGLARLTPAEVVDRIHVDDEMLEPHIVVSTHKAWERGRRIEGAHANDVHLRALVDRKSGAVRWQVWHELVYSDPAREIAGVNYRAADRLKHADLVLAEHWLDDCPGVDAPKVACNKYGRFVFELPGHVVEEIAANYRPDSRKPWRLRFKDGRGGSITGGLAPAEAAGLVAAVEQVRRERLTGG